MFKTILSPVVASAACERAADAAIALARRLGSKLTMLYVHGFEHKWGEAELLAMPGELDTIRENLDKHFAARLADVPGHAIAVEQGVPHVEILRLAREQGADLIVMCPHGRDLPRMDSLIWTKVGETTEQVISMAHCPVMLVNRTFKPQKALFRSILASTVFSKRDEAGVGLAAGLARENGASLTVLNVLDTDRPEGNLPQEELARHVDSRREWMAAEYGSLTSGVARIEYECLEGQAAVEILKLARQRQADLIVMAHQGGEEDPDCAFELSTVIRVACSALCPVMSVNRKVS